MMRDWHASLQEFRAGAVLVLGPASDGGASSDAAPQRRVIAVYPAAYAPPAAALAAADAFGAGWREARASLVAWKNFSRDEPGSEAWTADWIANGCMSMVRTDIPMPLQQGFECFVFCERQLTGKAEAACVAWTALSVWPSLKDHVLATFYGISQRELQVLRLIADGRKVRDAASAMDCSERTVHFHLTNLMAKLRADNRASVIQRACALGIL